MFKQCNRVIPTVMKRVLFLYIVTTLGHCSISQVPPEAVYPPDTLSITYHSSWTKTHYPERIREFKKMPLVLGDIIFLGNSITEQGGNWGKQLNWKNVKNRGISGDVTEGVLNRLGEIIYVKPKAVFLLIGINDLFNEATTPKYVAENIFAIVNLIRKESPNTMLYVQTILPTTTTTIKEKIRSTNTLLLKQSGQKTFLLLDTHALFVDENGLLKKDYTKDGVHLNDEGYTVWVDYLKKELPQYGY